MAGNQTQADASGIAAQAEPVCAAAEDLDTARRADFRDGDMSALGV